MPTGKLLHSSAVQLQEAFFSVTELIEKFQVFIKHWMLIRRARSCFQLSQREHSLKWEQDESHPGTRLSAFWSSALSSALYISINSGQYCVNLLLQDASNVVSNRLLGIIPSFRLFWCHVLQLSNSWHLFVVLDYKGNYL